MQALILNSGLGRRMGALTGEQPKCLTELSNGETILGRQLELLHKFGVTDIVITTGYFDQQIIDYCSKLGLPLNFIYVKNELYAQTNYIYSAYLAKDQIAEDVLLLHGDLVFEDTILDLITSYGDSRMIVSSTSPLSEKDFKAVISKGKILKVGVEFFEGAVAAQPLYKLAYKDFGLWMSEISDFINKGENNCYAENALNAVSEKMDLYPLECGNLICGEVDTADDLVVISERLRKVSNRKVYISFSTDMVHGGHIKILRRAAGIGKVTVGVLSDRAVASYKRYPLIPFEEKRTVFENVKCVDNVIEQDELSYKTVLLSERPDFVIHGDDWNSGPQKPIRDEVISVLSEYGGCLIEFPYSRNRKYEIIERDLKYQSALPDIRRAKLRKLLLIKPLITVIEAHNGLTGLIAEKTVVNIDGSAKQFDAMWVSSLCDSTAKGKPDIELVDISSRTRTLEDIIEVTTKPVILDGDSGGLTEHFVYTVRTLERLGVSAVIIEDKAGLKKNSLFGANARQTQDSVENFSEKIAAGKRAQKSSEFMIIARIESLILERGMEDALKRAFAFVSAGADGIMIHSRQKSPEEVFEFAKCFRAQDPVTPLVVVPTSFNEVTEDEFKNRGVNIVIYANHLIRSAFPAMRETAESILFNSRCKEADEGHCMPIKEILTLIPEE
ncbi:MAG: phosphoenolpyruvate mutase [Clostridiales bacterium]|nr:phosphoenolpyruvate mutase [Clostridiales bacterium]